MILLWLTAEVLTCALVVGAWEFCRFWESLCVCVCSSQWLCNTRLWTFYSYLKQKNFVLKKRRTRMGRQKLRQTNRSKSKPFSLIDNEHLKHWCTYVCVCMCIYMHVSICVYMCTCGAFMCACVSLCVTGEGEGGRMRKRGRWSRSWPWDYTEGREGGGRW